MKMLLLSGVAFALAVGPALAADLPCKAPPGATTTPLPMFGPAAASAAMSVGLWGRVELENNFTGGEVSRSDGGLLAAVRSAAITNSPVGG